MSNIKEIVDRCVDIMYDNYTIFPAAECIYDIFCDFEKDNFIVKNIKYNLQNHIGLNYIVSSEFKSIEATYQYINPKLKHLLINNIIVMVLDQFVTKKISFDINKKNEYINCLKRNNLIDEQNIT